MIVPSSLLRKTILWCIVLAVFLQAARAEEFGITRRTPAPSSQRSSQQILPYVVRIIAFDSTGQSFGTGSYVGIYGDYGVILTNHHVVSESNGLVHVHFPSGFSSYGTVVQSDQKWDLALIAISKPPQSVPTVPVAKNAAKPGDTLWVVGFGSGNYRIAEGKCVRYMALSTPDDDKEIMEVSVSARKGDSGGPILNQKGELAGVLFGSDMIRNSAGSFCERVNRFLTETQSEMAELPSRPETRFAAVETDGPRHSLRESRNAVPKIAAPAVPQVSGSTSSVRVRSSSRQYTPPSFDGFLRIQQAVPPMR